jgi:2,3-bisphosphoglycerate-independent phosphoglycerate mutase
MKPVILTILDGWGYVNQRVGNAIASANTPTLDEITRYYPSILLQASGRAVGMTFGEAGNSEVGHLTLGAGRIIYQYLMRINKSIETGEFFNNPTLVEATKQVQTNKSTLHIIGLLTSGAVHAYLGHLKALVEFAKKNSIDFKIHLFTDGRDSGLKESPQTLKKLSEEIGGLDNLGTLIGRDFAMDRNNNWQLTQTTYELLVNNKGQKTSDIFKTLTDYYSQNIYDANIPATVINQSSIKEGDAIVFFNFREDSMRQLTRTFIDEKFDIFPRTVPQGLYVAAMSQYLESSNLHIAFNPPSVPQCLSEVLESHDKKHFHIAETEKYAHVTFFFNGLHNESFPGETDFFIESLPTPLQNPEMRASDIVQKVISELDRDFYDFFVINFANGDILAHLGNLEATIKGVEAIDSALAALKTKVLEKDGILLITADHGNAESMIYKGTGEKETKHDENPVPFYIINKEYEKLRSEEEIKASRRDSTGLLADVAPTILDLMGIEKPSEMTGDSLLPLLALNN